MAVAALLDGIQAPGLYVRLANVVSRVAIRADGSSLVPVAEQRPVDSLLVQSRDSLMAGAAGRGNVAPKDPRGRVGRAPDIVHPVTRLAVGRGDEPALQNRTAVDAVLVERGDVADRYVSLLDHVRVAVTPCAGTGKVQRIGSGGRLLGRLDIVGAVAVGARRREALAVLAAGLGMYALPVVGDDLGVTARALGRGELIGMGQLGGGETGVTIDARETRLPVDRRGELLLRDEDGTAVGALGVLICVAGETVLVGRGLDRRSSARGGDANGKQQRNEEGRKPSPSRYFLSPG